MKSCGTRNKVLVRYPCEWEARNWLVVTVQRQLTGNETEGSVKYY